jgi:hypothetical protein
LAPAVQAERVLALQQHLQQMEYHRHYQAFQLLPLHLQEVDQAVIQLLQVLQVLWVDQEAQVEAVVVLT